MRPSPVPATAHAGPPRALPKRLLRIQRWLGRTPAAQRQLALLAVLLGIAAAEALKLLGVGPGTPVPVLFCAVLAAASMAGLLRSLLAVALALSYAALHLVGTGPALPEPGGMGVALLALAGVAPATALALRSWSRGVQAGLHQRARAMRAAAAAKGERHYLDFVNGLEALVWEVDPATGALAFVSGYGEKLLGYERGRWSEPGFHLERVHPDDREAVRLAREAVRRDGRARQIEYRLVARDGYTVWVRDSIALTAANRAGVRHLRGVAVDVTERKRAEEELRVEKERYRDLFEGVPVGLYRKTPRGRYLVANGALVRMLGYPGHQALYTSAEPEARVDLLDRWSWQDALVHGEGVRTFEVPCRRRDGTVIWVRNTARAVCDDEGAIAYYEGVLEDVTDRHLAEEAERAAQARFRGLVEQSLVGIFIIHRQRLVYVNPKMSEIFGYPSEDLTSLSSVLELVAEEHRGRVRDYLRRRLAAEDGQPLGFRGRRSDGSIVEVEVHGSRTEFGGSDAVLGTVLDITARKHAEERLHQLAFHDTLTGLPNRMLFMDRLEHALVRNGTGRICAVLFLDLNRFKVVNDSLGHPIGDQLLQAVAGRLLRCVSPGDTVARFGGDEFAVLLEEIAEAGVATRLAERIQEEVAAPIELNGYTMYTTASIGIAMSSDPRDRPEHILRSADMAMYRAKASGAARYEIFDRKMHADALVRLQLETELQWAVERSEFRLHYQPVVSLRTGELAGFEALVRWEHPERGLIYPSTFIPIAEELGLIVPMGRWIIRAACEQLRDWHVRRPGRPPPAVSVNVSAMQFLQSSIADDVEAVIRATGVDPGWLKLEITESVILENQDVAGQTVARLRALGVKILLDDFGTGYSNLGYLHHLPLDALKIDRSFVSRIGTEGSESHLVRTIVSLANNLGVDVVAEGIETEEQFTELSRLGCRYGQGYLFSPGRSAEELEGMIEDPQAFRPATSAAPLLSLERFG